MTNEKCINYSEVEANECRGRVTRLEQPTRYHYAGTPLCQECRASGSRVEAEHAAERRVGA